MEQEGTKIYFVTTDKSKAETEAIKQAKPPRLLLSYFYFRNKSLKEFTDRIGYRPEILVDSGAFTAWNTEKNISIVDYMNFLTENQEFITEYLALDVIGDDDLTYDYYKIMKKKGFKPTPVFHYNANEKYMYLYADDTTRVALGATVPIKDKSKVAKWINYLSHRFPGIKYHLLGSTSQAVTMFTDLDSCNSSAWILGAANGKPKSVPGTKVEKAIYNIKDILQRSTKKQVSLLQQIDEEEERE